MKHIIGLTATRHGMTAAQKHAFREFGAGRDCQLHHGCCVGGDSDGHFIAREFDWWVVGHPPIEPYLIARLRCDELRKPEAYLVRNRNIVDKVQIMLVVPQEMEEQQRGGTWSTFRYAIRIGKPTGLILPDGKVIWHNA